MHIRIFTRDINVFSPDRFMAKGDDCGVVGERSQGTRAAAGADAMSSGFKKT